MADVKILRMNFAPNEIENQKSRLRARGTLSQDHMAALPTIKLQMTPHWSLHCDPTAMFRGALIAHDPKTDGF
jgi:hypothetical protein